MRFSVIVPCYNVENYIDECVRSILAQSFTDFEVLLIDDGSQDDTGLKCDEWQVNDRRIRAYHKSNGGLSDARNYGIKNAQGDYLIFIDGDDFIDMDSFQNFELLIHRNTEVVITRLAEYYSQDEIKVKDKNMESELSRYPSKEEAVCWIMNGTKTTWPAVNKIVNRKFILKNGLWFKEGFLHEDMDWTVRLALVASSFASCSFIWYYHRMNRSGSITNTVKTKSITDVLIMAKDLIKLCENSNINYCDVIVNRIIDSVFISINKSRKLGSVDRYEIETVVQNNLPLLSLAKKPKHRLFVFVARILGVKSALRLLSLFS